jgi:hypothetical protein
MVLNSLTEFTSETGNSSMRARLNINLGTEIGI